MPAITFSAPVKLDSVPHLRERLPAELAANGVELTDDEVFAVKVCVTELVANSITHGFEGEAGNVSAELTVSADTDRTTGRLRLTAFDPGRGRPVERVGGLYELNGRGLTMIRAYASDLGWGPAPDPGTNVVGQQVWCELTIQSLTVQADTDTEDERPVSRSDIALQIASLGAASAVPAARPMIRVGSLRAALTAA